MKNTALACFPEVHCCPKSVLTWLILPALLFAGTLRAQPPSPDYELLFEENFDGQALNEARWTYRTGERSGVHLFRSINRKENVSVSGGELHITARQEMIDGKLANTGGGVISRHQFGYGYYETLSKPFMGGHGVHSAFWQAGGVAGPNSVFEIDAYEIDSKASMACHNLYIHISPKPFKEVPWVHRANVPFKLRLDGSYFCAYEYTPEGVIFYEDGGKVVARADWPELTAAQVVILSALNGTGKVDGQPGDTTFDYFRYYAKDYPGVNLLPNGSFEYNQDKVNPAKPVAWRQKGTAPDDTVRVTEGEVARDRYKLRLCHATKPFEITTQQKLEFIRNGDYELSAMVRRSGGLDFARVRVSVGGGDALIAEIPAAAAWTRIALPRIAVTKHEVTIAIEAKGSAGQWVEVDDVRFQKPALPGQSPTVPAFELIRDPIWSLAKKEPIHFAGDDKFYFFDRNVGLGDAITVAFTMKPERIANTMPVARVPKTGDGGWAVQLTEDGHIVFRIGSGAAHRAVVADAGCKVGAETEVVCIFDHGTAKVFVDGELKASESGIPFHTKDDTAAGRLGAVSNLYEAVGDVIVRSEETPSGITGKIPRYRNYAGSLRDVRIYNRALTATELAALR